MTAPTLRWSSVRSCARKAIYEATGSPARERSIRELGVLRRGKTLGRDYVLGFAERHNLLIYVGSGDDRWVPPLRLTKDREQAGVLAEEQVLWPLGVGHMDMFIVSTCTAVEILSSAFASDAMVQSKLLQLTGYLEHYEPATNGALVVLSPSDLTETDRYIVNVKSDAYRALVEEMHDRIASVTSWSETGELPERVCAKPNDAYGHFCLNAEHCFTDWEAPELVPVEDPLVHELAINLYLAKRAEHAAKQLVSTAEEERKAIQEQLADHLDEGEHEIGSLTVKRSVTNRAPTLDLKKARLAIPGFDEIVADFLKPGATYSTWFVDRHGDAPLIVPGADDESAPWTEADLAGPWDAPKEAA